MCLAMAASSTGMRKEYVQSHTGYIAEHITNKKRYIVAEPIIGLRGEVNKLKVHTGEIAS